MKEHQKGHHVRQSASITLNAPPEQVFPLFGPVRESEWAEGWSPEIVYSGSPLAEEEGAIFLTRHDGMETTWVVTRYEPDDYRIEYARITPGAAAMRVLVCCEAGEENKTIAHITYEITALGEGSAGVYETHYPEMMAHWEEVINKALAKRI
jgi:hypothetical protein